MHGFFFLDATCFAHWYRVLLLLLVSDVGGGVVILIALLSFFVR
jgi:hypothetical protein